MKDVFMKQTIELAQKGAGFVNPHPLSAALIVKEGEVISKAFYRAFGEEPAELQALNCNKENPLNAEMYLNIEPFRGEENNTNFIKRAAQCGIKKIYIGMLNPDPDKKMDLISGLKMAGIAVETGLLQASCDELNEIYSHYIIHKTPFVFVKWAMTLDGKLATKTGDSKWISSEESLKFVHVLRQRVAAIMVGENTVKMDNPLLTTRLEGVEISNPLRVILSMYGDLPEESNVLNVDSNTKTLIIASENIPSEKENKLVSKGVQVIKLKEKNNKIDFKDIIQALGNIHIDSLYIEGGSSVLGAAFESGVIQKVYAAVAPKIVGGKNAVTPVGGSGIEKMNDAIVLKRVTHQIVGGDVIFQGYI